MSRDNPYQSPSSDVAQPSGRIRITNYNLAGGPLAVAFVIGPLLLLGAYSATVSGWSKLPESQRGGRVAWLTLWSAVELGALVYAVRVPILWVEIGPTLRHATLTRIQETPWPSVQRIWFDRQDERGPLFVKFASHHALVVQINDYQEVRAIVPADRLNLIHAIVAKLPQFKNSPFDEEIPGTEDQNADD